MTKWIKEKTNGTLAPEMELDPETMLSIINTLYLKDEWTDRFDKNSTADGTFTKANGEKVTCSFMNAKESGLYARGKLHRIHGKHEELRLNVVHIAG